MDPIFPVWANNLFGPAMTLSLCVACYCAWASVLSFVDDKDRQGRVFRGVAVGMGVVFLLCLAAWGLCEKVAS
jgi:amino acid permease